MKRIIINGDDFGLSYGINEGIIMAYRAGVLSSASLMVNMPAFEDAIDLIRGNPGLDIGIHINFFRGRPVLPHCKTKTLTDNNGFFLRDPFKIIKGIYQKHISLVELESECDAQIKKALDSGINITHLDSEKHLHLFGDIYRIIVKLCKENRIFKIRNINELPYFFKFALNPGSVPNLGLFKLIMLQFLSRRIKKINSANAIKTTDYSFGFLGGGCMTSCKYERLFNCLKDGTTEIICHVGRMLSEAEKESLQNDKYHLTVSLETELFELINPGLKKIISNSNISLINHGGEE
jgi:predicted glycoside hydrolase/deacetylase ChbG (UPF0249 family)